MKRFALAAALLPILAAAALAGPVIAPVQPPATVTPLDPARTTTPCIVGNDAAPAWVVDFVTPPQKFAHFIDANENTCGQCPLGFRVTTIHAVLQTEGPCTLTMEAILMTGEGRDCAEPVAAYCGSLTQEVAIPGAGLWDVGIPVTCACADPDYPFFLKVEFETGCAEGGAPWLVTDDFPMGCRNYVDGPGGWEGLPETYQFPGNLLFWAEAGCCGNPVADESTSWGGLKTYYR